MKARFPIFPIALLSLFFFNETITAKPKKKKNKKKTKIHKVQIIQKRPRLSRYRLGVHTGFQFAYAKSNPVQEGSTRNAAALHVILEKRLKRGWYLETGLTYAQRGVQTTLFEVAGVDVKGNVHLDYLEFPLTLKAQSKLAKTRLRLFLLAGPSVAIALKRQVDILGVVNLSLSNRFTSIDTLFHVGGGLEYRFTRQFALTTQLRYGVGLFDIDRSESSYKTRAVQLLGGVLVGF